MGIQKTKTLYISDRGDEFVLEEMQYSHLLNVYNHHTTQLNTLKTIIEKELPSANMAIHQRVVDMKETLKALQYEIVVRDLDEGHITARNHGYV